jgi:hypothetical protein
VQPVPAPNVVLKDSILLKTGLSAMFIHIFHLFCGLVFINFPGYMNFAFLLAVPTKLFNRW